MSFPDLSIQQRYPLCLNIILYLKTIFLSKKYKFHIETICSKQNMKIHEINFFLKIDIFLVELS